MQSNRIKCTLFVLVLPGIMMGASCGGKKTEAEIGGSVTAALHKNKDLAHITVTAHEGVATLSGWVKEPAMASAAEAVALEVEGIQEVVSELAIGINPAEQEQLGAAVRNVIRPYERISAIISDSVVMLNGRISKSSLPVLVQQLEALKVKKVVTKDLVEE
ncbi:BON domain-containing protein [Niabella sp. CC-SYL272]|uniref:BON domain-containing protein n=1 Tax=Niabella agricola TaxID=2891571 RepID=UPI001F411425|nr:BON domain-containing protein [Niabella agricola]MCF3112012.1 BON domain-containing protein [Niabella agricola]